MSAASSSAKPRLICLTGPTASGKTELAIALAGELNCELVSVDSALVYRGLDIGSAKPDYPHHLIDIREPQQPYSAADFASDAQAVVADIIARGKTPLLVGGTMLYFRAFLDGLADMPAADVEVRQAIEREAAQSGWPALHRQLQEVDPESAARIHPNHSQRLSRALEVYRSTGVPISEWQRQQPSELPSARFDLRQLVICPRDRKVLHRRIEQRFQQMMAQGFLQEVQELYAQPQLHADLPAIRAVGYRQLWQHLDGECSLEEAVERAIAATRQLAKRQLTWLRKWPELYWMDTDEQGNILPNQGSQHATSASISDPLQVALNYIGANPI
ncbi:tRNA (adenosine(37)-N6)-dimethylallyltransferase MiaA [Parahaliea sp. F7430]|uniref:tRNA dimethylallyltransferase n=1 Tax=Sediminihaliea albiluteola TaxID=2758564 RepID=A0A7W2TTG1_9GAMM|nr:tRNA (adenosine(37)-N6)-dimethylallyltransferase MiaA [Sediminihaliea albiluteola]MBA6411623.1 tRNA (adenosine(37)-N6)-dimethylallyltransferase MiaA [Sediminihaliea albiluteola]